MTPVSMDAIDISSRTVAGQVEHILDKLNAPSRAAATAYALREGLILGRIIRHDRWRSVDPCGG